MGLKNCSEIDSAKLEQIQVAQNAARNALNSLRKCEVVELKSFQKPPQVTLVTVECMVLILKLAPIPKEGHEYWEIGKRKILSDVQFLFSLTSVDLLAVLTSNEPPIAQVMEHANDPLLETEKAKSVNTVTWAFVFGFVFIF
ncbi:hypothetical protein THRCLA_21460 [Thraustotheca clavata]|uniref:Dynein heavy chain coiled coil stalk domain-containing protein n=1 Tax=Thraustotheca clavata TaxID=74557 RepID=A0A1V9ZWC0_9STRA|nr:hypothetical protein THRCLA_21460 [Thraustotheca clavata]